MTAVTVYLAIGSTISAYAWPVCRRRGDPLSDPAIVVGVVLVGLCWPVTAAVATVQFLEH